MPEYPHLRMLPNLSQQYYYTSHNHLYYNINNNQGTMKNYIEQVYETSDSQTHNPYLIPSGLFYFPEGFLPSCAVNAPPNFSFETLSKEPFLLPTGRQFVRRRDKTIVLRSGWEGCASPKQLGVLYPGRKRREVEIRKRNKPIQKQSRNVSSNLLRIFFKNTLEMKAFDPSIQKNIERMDLNITQQDFHHWLSSFNINFKNYIRTSQLRSLFRARDCGPHQRILSALLRQYLKTHAVLHCLTSKKIEAGSVGMHLAGLRELYQEANDRGYGGA